MAREVDALTLQMSADLRRFEKSMQRMSQTADRRLTEVERRARQQDRNLSRIMGRAGENMTAAFRDGLKGLAPTLAAAFSVRQIIRYADGWTDLTSRVRLAVGEHENAEDVMTRISVMARRTYSSLDQTAEGFLQNAVAMRELGYSTSQTLDFVETLNNAMVVSGAKGQRAESVMNALTKAMAFGELRGDNLNTVLQSGGRVTEILAQSLGVATTELRRMGEQGLLKTDVLVRALTGSMEQLRQEADSMPATVGDAFQLLNNALGELVGRTDQGLSATERMAQAIVALADNLEVVATAAGIFVTIVGTRMVVAQGAATLAAANHARAQIALIAAISGTTRASIAGAVAMRGLGAASMFFLANPIGLAITAVALALGVMALRSRQASDAVRAQDEVERRAAPTKDRLATLTNNLANASRDRAAAIREEINALLELERIEAARLRENYNQAKATARGSGGQTAEGAIAAIGGDPSSPFAREAARQINEMVEARGRAGAVMYEGLDIGAAPETRQTREARAAYQAQLGVIRAMEDAVRDAESTRASASTSAGGGGGGASGAGRDDSDRIAGLRDRLELEERLTFARASGDEAAIRAEEERQRLIELTARYLEAGYDDALTRAMGLVALENRILEVEEERAALAKSKEASERAIAEHAEREAAILDDRLRYEAELARLRGDRSAIEAAERALYIRTRVVELMRQEVGLTEDLARARASAEWTERTGAFREGNLRYEMQSAAGVFIDAIRGRQDVFGALGAHFADVASDHLRDILGDLLTSLFSSQGGGSGIGGAIGGFLKGLIPGFASGTSSAPGGLAYVHKGEVLANLPKGTSVIPAHAVRAMGQMQGVQPGAAGRQVVEYRVVVVPDEPSFITLAEGAAQGPAMAAERRAVRTSLSASQKSAPGMQQRMRRLGTP